MNEKVFVTFQSWIPPHQYYSGDQIKKTGMEGACRMYGGQERCVRGFGGEN